MPSTFPGMNPYLEHPDLWPGVHHYLISEIARFLSPQLRPKYRVAVEVRMYESRDESLLVGIPDVIVKSCQTATNLSANNVAVAAPTIEPIRVKISVPLTIKEGYLEVREVGSEVCCLIQIPVSWILYCFTRKYTEIVGYFKHHLRKN